MHALARSGACALAALGFAAADARGDPIYWGAHINSAQYGLPAVPADMRAVDVFESHTRKRPSILTFGNSWMNSGLYEPFPLQKFENVRLHGSIPFYTWGSRDGALGSSQPDFRPSVIASGRHDAYIRQFATDARNWGHPLFLRFDWEMNGWWYPWGEGRTSDGTIVNGNRPGDYVAMWRHVRDVFRDVGATNVTWVWCVNHMSRTTQYPALSTVYPGDTYVDWTGMDPYNRYPATWLTFAQTMTGIGTDWLKNTYQELRAVAPAKPTMLAEYASYEDPSVPSRKAAWIKDAHQVQLPTAFSAIKAVIWFNWHLGGTGGNLPIESSATAQAAFAETIASENFTSNGYGAMPPVTITPPRPNVHADPIASADTYADASRPTTAFGSSPTLVVNGSPIRRTFIKFDLTPLAGRVVTSARLQLTTTADVGAGSAGTLTLKRVDQADWSERYLTYNNTVTPTNIVLGTAAGIAANATKQIPLDLLSVQPRVGSVLSMSIESSSADDVLLSARETTAPPVLHLTFNGP